MKNLKVTHFLLKKIFLSYVIDFFLKLIFIEKVFNYKEISIKVLA